MKDIATVYKVVRTEEIRGKERKFSIVAQGHSSFTPAMEYSTDSFTQRHNWCGPLFAFNDLDRAKKFADEWKSGVEVWECVGMGVRSKAKFSYWQNQIRTGHSFFTGTVFCNKIKLKTKVYSNEGN